MKTIPALLLVLCLSLSCKKEKCTVEYLMISHGSYDLVDSNTSSIHYGKVVCRFKFYESQVKNFQKEGSQPVV